MENTINELTNEFQSFQNIPIEKNINSSPERFLSFTSFLKQNYKKILILLTILFIISIFIVIFFLDEKFYKKEEKVQILSILLDSFLILLLNIHVCIVLCSATFLDSLFHTALLIESDGYIYTF